MLPQHPSGQARECPPRPQSRLPGGLWFRHRDFLWFGVLYVLFAACLVHAAKVVWTLQRTAGMEEQLVQVDPMRRSRKTWVIVPHAQACELVTTDPNTTHITRHVSVRVGWQGRPGMVVLERADEAVGRDFALGLTLRCRCAQCLEDVDRLTLWWLAPFLVSSGYANEARDFVAGLYGRTPLKITHRGHQTSVQDGWQASVDPKRVEMLEELLRRPVDPDHTIAVWHVGPWDYFNWPPPPPFHPYPCNSPPWGYYAGY